MHNHLPRFAPRPLTANERTIQHDEELTVTLEELAALKESLDTSYRAYRRTPTLRARGLGSRYCTGRSSQPARSGAPRRRHRRQPMTQTTDAPAARLWRWIREPANGQTHLAGVLLAVVALGVLLAIAIGTGAPRALVGLVVFGVTQIALYTANTLHYSLRLTPRGHRRLLKFDLAMIVVFIAGTYTPVCPIALPGGWRWGLLGGVWGLALGGFVWITISVRAPRWFSTGYFVLLGWVGLVALPPIVRALPWEGNRLDAPRGRGVHSRGSALLVRARKHQRATV